MDNYYDKFFSFFIVILLVISLFCIFVPLVYASDTLFASNVPIDSGSNVALIRAVHPSGTSYASSWGETFTSSSVVWRLTSAQFLLLKSGSPTGNINVELFEITGTIDNGKPTGSALAVSDPVASSSLTTTKTWTEFVFSGANIVNLAVNHNYGIAIVGTTTTINSINYVISRHNNTAGVYYGCLFDYESSAWTFNSATTNLPYKLYGIAGGVSFSGYSVSSYENGVSTSLGVTCTKVGTSELSQYIFSWDISGSYVNNSVVNFGGNSPQTISISKLIFGTLGQTVHWLVYADDVAGVWSVSAIQSFVIQATVTFYFNDTNCVFQRNSVTLGNGTTTVYTSPTNLTFLAIVNSMYGFLSFNWSNIISSSMSNPYAYSVINNSVVWCNFFSYSAVNITGYNQGYSIGYSVGYSVGYSDGYSVGYSVGYSTGWLAGNSTGWLAGNFTGYIDGYAVGYAQGFFDGGSEIISAPIDYNEICLVVGVIFVISMLILGVYLSRKKRKG